MSTFRQYRRKQIAELRPYEPGEDLDALNVSISAEDKKAGSPKAGDMIARNPKNHADQWLRVGGLLRRQLRAHRRAARHRRRQAI